MARMMVTRDKLRVNDMFVPMMAVIEDIGHIDKNGNQHIKVRLGVEKRTAMVGPGGHLIERIVKEEDATRD